jgi:predicted nucleic acid-binding protein
MRSKFPSIELPLVPLAIDASVMLNLLGTGVAELLLDHLGCPIVMAENAVSELKYHPIHKTELKPLLDSMKQNKSIEEKKLGPAAKDVWRELVGDGLEKGLDDGEAATIAMSVVERLDAVVVLDESKARKVFAERWPDRLCVDTVTLLAQRRVGQGLQDALADACFMALQHARMRVPAEAMAWLVGVIGRDRASQCKAVRRSLIPRE